MPNLYANNAISFEILLLTLEKNFKFVTNLISREPHIQASFFWIISEMKCFRNTFFWDIDENIFILSSISAIFKKK